MSDLDSFFIPNFFKTLFALFSGLTILLLARPTADAVVLFVFILLIGTPRDEVELVEELVEEFSQKHFPGKRSNRNSRSKR